MFAVRAVLDAGVVAGGEVVAFERGQAVEEGAVLDVLVAAQAGVRGAAGGVFGHEAVHHRLAEAVFEVHDVVADAELAGHPAGVVDVFDAAALLASGELGGTLLGPEAHGDADDVVALLDEEGGGDGAIDSAGHADDDPRRLHGCATISGMAALPPGMVHLEAEALANRAVDVLSEHQALDIALLDISRTATFTDYFVIATAQSPLQFDALKEYLERGLEPEGHRLRHREGSADSGWVLLDFGEIIVHLFSPEKREYYRLEELWGRTAQVVRFTG